MTPWIYKSSSPWSYEPMDTWAYKTINPSMISYDQEHMKLWFHPWLHELYRSRTSRFMIPWVHNNPWTNNESMESWATKSINQWITEFMRWFQDLLTNDCKSSWIHENKRKNITIIMSTWTHVISPGIHAPMSSRIYENKISEPMSTLSSEFMNSWINEMKAKFSFLLVGCTN